MKNKLMCLFVAFTIDVYAENDDFSCQAVTSAAQRTAMSDFLHSMMYSVGFSPQIANYCIKAGFYEKNSLVDVRIKNALQDYSIYKKRADIEQKQRINAEKQKKLQLELEKAEQEKTVTARALYLDRFESYALELVKYAITQTNYISENSGFFSEFSKKDFYHNIHLIDATVNDKIKNYINTYPQPDITLNSLKGIYCNLLKNDKTIVINYTYDSNGERSTPYEVNYPNGNYTPCAYFN